MSTPILHQSSESEQEHDSVNIGEDVGEKGGSEMIQLSRKSGARLCI